MKIKDSGQFSHAAVTAVLALCFAGSAMTVIATALEAGVPAWPMYLAALIAAVLCAAATLSTAGRVVAGVCLALTAGIYAAGNAQGFSAMREVFASWTARTANADLAALGMRAILTCGAFTLSTLFFALIHRRGMAGMAILILTAILIPCYALSRTTSLTAALPGLMAAAAAFALTGERAQDLSVLKALIPAALAVTLAFLLLPADGTTWGPMERAAMQVRSIFEQYFRFTRERIAFSISEQGYDHAGQIGETVVSMLGGPADPHTEPVMRVSTDTEVLLRGTVRTSYTGYSWVDTVPRSRYLYYDLTHRTTRDGILAPSEALKGALDSTVVSVEILKEGTSTLFVSGLLEHFDMDLSTAVYYNTAGEMFLSRPVQPGDHYELRALVPIFDDQLRQAVLRGEEAEDEIYRQMIDDSIQLPEGIDGGVYALTMRVIDGAQNDWDRAVAIQQYLRQNMRYTLEPDIPPRGRDFVSHFLLDTQEGYCSYYASAMAVMGRIAGLPTRYVEGYLARPGREVLTGENAHAWAEIYFRGIGWIPFDATGGTTGGGAFSDGPADPGQNGEDPEDGHADGGETSEGGEEKPEPTLPPDQNGQMPPPQTPVPDPVENSAEEDRATVPDSQPQAQGEGAEAGPGGKNRSILWLALLLILVAGLALAARWAFKRLRESDPALLCMQCKSEQQAALILYRANLTALAHLGQVPRGGETPEAFSERVSSQLDNVDFVDFARAVGDANYSRKPLRHEAIEAGLRAYRRFVQAMGMRERLQFLLTRLRKGLGDFDSIP